MKKAALLFLLLFLPCMNVSAQDYTLKNGKAVTGTYSGSNEEDFNYYLVTPSKSGYLAITAKTSDKKKLRIDICDKDKKVIASDIGIANNKTVLHKASKKKQYYLRIKGTEGSTYRISYKIKTLEKLVYAKKYNYTFTNASFNNQKNAIYLKVRTSRSGILHFMCNADSGVTVKYLNSKKKAISSNSLLYKKVLTGIGVQANKNYYIKLWKPESVTSGTTTIQNIKYQIDSVSSSNSNKKSKARTLSKGKYTNTLVPAGKTTTSWYKMKVTKKQKLSITVESRLLQNNGKNLKLYICNTNGKKINKKPIVIAGEASAVYKKKYIMKYPKTTFATTVAFPQGTYYLRVESNTKTTSGSYRIKWK